jgi:hypothetical protein
MSNLEEEIIEETTPIRENLWETRKASISCQNPLRLSSRESGRYDLQMISFRRFRNATPITIERPKRDVSTGPLANANTYK